MKIDDNIRDEKLQYDVNREAAKLSPLLSSKIDKYEYLTDGEILSPDQRKCDKNKLSLHILLSVKHLKNKQKRLKRKRENNLKRTKRRIFWYAISYIRC